MWQHAVDNFDLDPGWQTCPSCDMDFDRMVRFVNGLCPDCARERELAEAAEEEMADALAGDEKEGR